MSSRFAKLVEAQEKRKAIEPVSPSTEDSPSTKDREATTDGPSISDSPAYTDSLIAMDSQVITDGPSIEQPPPPASGQAIHIRQTSRIEQPVH